MPFSAKAGAAAGLVILATLLRLFLLDELGSYYPFVIFYPAVLLAVHYGGLWCGLSATFLSLLSGYYCWFDHDRHPAGQWSDWQRLAFFLFFGIVVSIVIDFLQRRLAHAYHGKERAEEALSEANHRLELERDILQTVMNGAKNCHLVYLDTDFNFVRVNETYARTCGYAYEEMIGRNHFALYPNEENQAIFAHVRDTGEEVEIFDKPFVFPDQPERGVTYWNWTLSPVKDGVGKVVGLVFSLVETTRHKQAEAALRESEERFRVAFEESAVAQAMAALDGRMQKANAPFSRMLGYSDDELVGLGLAQVTHPDDLPDLLQIKKLIAGEIPFMRLDKRYFTKSGGIVWGDTSSTCVRDEHGKPLYLLVVIQDITGRKRIEKELQQLNEALEQRVIERTEELRQKDCLLVQQNRLAAMGEMVNNIAHQWRQPLNALGLNVQQLKAFYDSGRLTGELLDAGVDNAMMLVKHMSTTIDDFRQYFRPDRDREEFPVKDVVKATIKLLEAAFRRNDITLVMQCDAEPLVVGYPNQYAQVLLNILTNAKDAFEGGDCSNARIQLNLGICGDRSQLTVIDNAGGIPAEIIDRIFDPHFTTKEQGTGIGLFMAKNIIERHMRGRITAANTGEGACFVIEV